MIKVKRNMFSKMLAVAIFVIFLNSATWADVIQNIRIEGAERIDPATVMTYLDIQPGDDLTQDNLNQSLKTLFGTGLFSDINFYQDGDDLVVSVVENPVINEIAFEGNKKLKDEDLKAEINLRPRVVFTRTKVQADIERLLDIYRLKGLFSVNIDPKIIMLDQNRVNLVFEISEGPETRIRRVSFIGNEFFDDGTLSDVIASKEARWYRFLTSNDKYDPDRLAYDKELLRRFYLNRGYADFQITSAVAELSADRRDFFLTFTLEEGNRYKIGSISVDNRVSELDSDWVKSLIDLKVGDWYDASAVEDSIVNLTNEIGNRQYAFIDIRPQIDKKRNNNEIEITFVINESAKAFVKNININGNIRTLDEVIRREMLLVEGDPFNRSKLQKSEQKIKDLNYFEEVKVRLAPTAVADMTDIEIDVQEKSTGELSIGAGYSTTDGPLGNLNIRENNLLGRGQKLEFNTVLSGIRSQFDIRFTEPYFLDRDLEAGIDLFHITRNLQTLSTYDQRRTGFALRTGYPVAHNLRQSLRYRLEDNEIKNVASNASLFIKQQQGSRMTSAISQRLTYDTRDSTLTPTEGGIVRFDTEIAGLGGEARYVSTKIGANYYWPIYKKQWIFSVLGEAGYIFAWGGEDIRINERFYLGGAKLRGFERAGVGPRDKSTRDSLGGNQFYRGSVELAFPLGLSEDFGIKGHAFSDFGNLWNVDDSGAGIFDDNTIRLSVGLGLSWRSPLGPIRVDLATAILDGDYDEKEVFRFSFGTSF